MRLGPAVRRSLRIAVSLAIAVYILVDVDRGDLRRALEGVRPGLFAAALLIYVGGQVLSAYKWTVVGRSVGLDRSLLEYTRFYFIGMFFNLFGPSTIGGDVVRALYL
jgi:glycosyltransferase 2 family protein